MHTLNLDTEQAELVLLALETGHRLMDARLNRADPDGIISASQELQRRKIEQIGHQIALGPISRWDDLLPIEQEEFKQLCRVLGGANSDMIASSTYEHMTVFCTTHRTEKAMREALETMDETKKR